MGTIDLTALLEALIALIAVVITGYLVPYIKAKTSEKAYENLERIVSTAVNAAEQLAKTGVINKEDKKEYVMGILNSHGFTLDYKQLEAAIECAVSASNRWAKLAATEPVKFCPGIGEVKARDEPEDSEGNDSINDEE